MKRESKMSASSDTKKTATKMASDDGKCCEDSSCCDMGIGEPSLAAPPVGNPPPQYQQPLDHSAVPMPPPPYYWPFNNNSSTPMNAQGNLVFVQRPIRFYIGSATLFLIGLAFGLPLWIHIAQERSHGNMLVCPVQ